MRIVALVLLLLAGPAAATTIVLDFEEEPTGSYRDGATFTSIECGCVTFAETGGGWLFVHDVAGNRVLIPGEEGGRLLMTFHAPVTALSLDFGNDLDDSETIGDAVLEGLVGDTVVVSASVTPNQNDRLDQTISISYAGVLTSARFRLPQSGESEPVSPTVDNIVLEVATVPEASTVALLLLLSSAAIRSRAR